MLILQAVFLWPVSCKSDRKCLGRQHIWHLVPSFSPSISGESSNHATSPCHEWRTYTGLGFLHIRNPLETDIARTDCCRHCRLLNVYALGFLCVVTASPYISLSLLCFYVLKRQTWNNRIATPTNVVWSLHGHVDRQNDVCGSPGHELNLNKGQ